MNKSGFSGQPRAMPADCLLPEEAPQWSTKAKSSRSAVGCGVLASMLHRWPVGGGRRMWGPQLGFRPRRGASDAPAL
eukprot:9480410-Pyramimonas_sp.AAC.1